MLDHGEFIELQEYNQRDMNQPSFKERQANDDTMKSVKVEEENNDDSMGQDTAPF
jgi:hypothetical protein